MLLPKKKTFNQPFLSSGQKKSLARSGQGRREVGKKNRNKWVQKVRLSENSSTYDPSSGRIIETKNTD